MAAGWPKNGEDKDGNEVVKEGSRPARLLHMVRRAERNLMSYERTGMQLNTMLMSILCCVRDIAEVKSTWRRISSMFDCIHQASPLLCTASIAHDIPYFVLFLHTAVGAQPLQK